MYRRRPRTLPETYEATSSLLNGATSPNPRRCATTTSRATLGIFDSVTLGRFVNGPHIEQRGGEENGTVPKRATVTQTVWDSVTMLYRSGDERGLAGDEAIIIHGRVSSPTGILSAPSMTISGGETVYVGSARRKPVSRRTKMSYIVVCVEPTGAPWRRAESRP